jgi:hypothetical protein
MFFAEIILTSALIDILSVFSDHLEMIAILTVFRLLTTPKAPSKELFVSY